MIKHHDKNATQGSGLFYLTAPSDGPSPGGEARQQDLTATTNHIRSTELRELMRVLPAQRTPPTPVQFRTRIQEPVPPTSSLDLPTSISNQATHTDMTMDQPDLDSPPQTCPWDSLI